MTAQSYAHRNTAATAAVSATPTRLGDVVVGTGAAGTLEIHDCATTGAVGAGNLVALIDTTTARAWQFNIYLRLGLVVVQTGTADICLTHS